jgi:hypothetical protein
MNTNNKVPVDTLEDELDAVRIKLYEQTKHMTPKERTAHVSRHAREILDKQGLTGIKFVSAPPSDAPAKQA